MTDTARVKYVFVDIVGFTVKRSVEAQIDVIAGLNEVVRSALKSVGIGLDQTIFLPTGDGIAIALLNVELFDAHLKVALEILRLTTERNDNVSDVMRQFIVRIGINENVDNLVIDINDNKNVAGNGISMAQRLMDLGDGGQIIVGATVYETLFPREKYMKSFRGFVGAVKHGKSVPVYQFLSNDSPGLNVNVPATFKAKEVAAPPTLTKLAAYYIAHAEQNRQFLVSEKGNIPRDVIAIVLLSFLATDSEEKSDTPVHVASHAVTWKAGSATFAEQYQHYKEVEFLPLLWLAHLFAEKHFTEFSLCFESDGYLPRWAFIADEGIRRLRAEWPEIADEFRITGRTS